MWHLPILLILCIALFFFFIAYMRQRLLMALPTSKLAVVRPGYRELQGVARAAADGALLDPIQNQPCVWFRVETYRQEERVTRDGRTGKQTVHRVWELVDEAESPRAFVLEDGSGQCLVAPAGAKIEVGRSRVYAEGGFFRPRIRHDIARIRAGEPLFVLGDLRADGAAQFRMENPQDGSAFLITTKSEQQMLRSAKHQQIAAGVVATICVLALIPALFNPSPSQLRDAYAEARAAAAPTQAAIPTEAPVTQNADDLLVEKPKSLSALSEAERSIVLRRQRWIEQLRANHAYAGLERTPPILSVVDQGASVIVTSRADRELTLFLGRLTTGANAESRLCVLHAPNSAADGATRLKPKESAAFELPSDCPTRGPLDYRIGTHADLDSPETIGWWSMSAIEREEDEINRTIGE